MELLGKEIAKDVKDLIISGTPAAVGVTNPVAGVALTIAGECAKKIDGIKLMYITNSLGKDLNEEMFKNMLVNYIKDSDERAMLVVNTFRKAILQDSLIAVTLMGILLSENIDANVNPSHEDLILYKALESSNDIDLKNFRKMLQEKVVKNDQSLSDTERLTCRWCAQNRIFDEHIMEWNIKEQYTCTSVSERLFLLMREVPSYLWK